MTSWRAVEGLAVGTVLLLTLVTGVGSVPGAGTPTAPIGVGDGTAAVTVDSSPEDGLRISPGRFGAGALYLRIPDVELTISSVEGAPRLYYRVEVPKLDVTASAEHLLGPGATGRTIVRAPDRGLDPAAVDRDQYVAHVTIRVQSFEVDETIYAASQVVAVDR